MDLTLTYLMSIRARCQDLEVCKLHAERVRIVMYHFPSNDFFMGGVIRYSFLVSLHLRFRNLDAQCREQSAAAIALRLFLAKIGEFAGQT